MSWFNVAKPPAEEVWRCPVHGIIKPMWLSVDGGIKPYGPVCKQCYGEWIVRSLPPLQDGFLTEA